MRSYSAVGLSRFVPVDWTNLNLPAAIIDMHREHTIVGMSANNGVETGSFLRVWFAIAVVPTRGQFYMAGTRPAERSEHKVVPFRTWRWVGRSKYCDATCQKSTRPSICPPIHLALREENAIFSHSRHASRIFSLRIALYSHRGKHASAFGQGAIHAMYMLSELPRRPDGPHLCEFSHQLRASE